MVSDNADRAGLAKALMICHELVEKFTKGHVVRGFGVGKFLAEQGI